MVDIVDTRTRSRMMSGIRGKDTQPELRLRSDLHKRGLRFRVHRSDLPGRPDIVFPSAMSVVLVHGCFWHRHHNCRFATVPTTRATFWADKFDKNVARDQRNINDLRRLGWRVKVVWECEVRRDVEEVAARIVAWLK